MRSQSVRRDDERSYPNRSYGCELDPANPAFYIKDYRERGMSLRAEWKLAEGESAAEYWRRVKTDARP
jgi:hypothetical protein